MPRPLYEDGKLGPVTWQEPPTWQLMLAVAAVYALPILVPLAVAIVVVVARCG